MRLRQVAMRYAMVRSSVPVLDGIDLDVRRGAIIGGCRALGNRVTEAGAIFRSTHTS